MAHRFRRAGTDFPGGAGNGMDPLAAFRIDPQGKHLRRLFLLPGRDPRGPRGGWFGRVPLCPGEGLEGRLRGREQPGGGTLPDVLVFRGRPLAHPFRAGVFMRNQILNHRGTETRRKKYFCLSLCLRVSVVIILFLPSVLLACPRCVDATPYKTGMQVAVAVLLPIPIVLVTALFFWIRNASKAET